MEYEGQTGRAIIRIGSDEVTAKHPRLSNEQACRVLEEFERCLNLENSLWDQVDEAAKSLYPDLVQEEYGQEPDRGSQSM